MVSNAGDHTTNRQDGAHVRIVACFVLVMFSFSDGNERTASPLERLAHGLRADRDVPLVPEHCHIGSWGAVPAVQRRPGLGGVAVPLPLREAGCSPRTAAGAIDGRTWYMTVRSTV